MIARHNRVALAALLPRPRILPPVSRARKAAYVLCSAGALSIVGGGVASAYWTTTGTGTATAETPDMTFDAVAATGETPGSTLVPGGTAELVVKVHNTNAYSIRVSDIAANGAVPVTAANSCPTTGVAFSGAGIDYLDTQFALDPNETAVLRLPAAATMTTAVSNLCQGTTFSIPVTVTVRR